MLTTKFDRRLCVKRLKNKTFRQGRSFLSARDRSLVSRLQPCSSLPPLSCFLPCKNSIQPALATSLICRLLSFSVNITKYGHPHLQGKEGFQPRLVPASFVGHRVKADKSSGGAACHSFSFPAA